MSAIQQWRQQAAAHHIQSFRAQGLPETSGDFWQGNAESFRADPRRTDDRDLNHLLAMVRPQDAVIDVGGGAGRYSLALALKCRHVTVVEPSEAMVAVLEDGARQHGITNVTAVTVPWETAAVEPADIVLSTHVLYTVVDIEPFLSKMDSHARRLVVVHLWTEFPQAYLATVWQQVHGEERANLPGMSELMSVLWEMGIYPNLEMLDAEGPRTYPDVEGWRRELRRRLYVEPGTEQDRRVEQVLASGLVQTPQGLALKGAKGRRLGVAWWGKG
ncbi:MAG: methyltransferase domain-containing protein [Chloroflexi bacterium]|nr:methyltransferase domain-containing protein [Chloroflexota bacterium]